MALDKTLLDLKTDYLDLWLIHWPIAFHFVPFDPTIRGFHEKYDPDGCSELDLSKFNGSKIDSTVSIRETWEEMEKMVQKGKVKSIGVSNFTAILIHDLLSYAKIKPVINQVESHIYLQQPSLLSYLKNNNILMQAYSPLGAGNYRKNIEPKVLEDPVIQKIANKHRKSPAQVSLRWNFQRGVCVVPKSCNMNRIKENIDIFNFSLDEQDMEEIQKIDKNYHFLRPSQWYGIPLFGDI